MQHVVLVSINQALTDPSITPALRSQLIETRQHNALSEQANKQEFIELCNKLIDAQKKKAVAADGEVQFVEFIPGLSGVTDAISGAMDTVNGFMEDVNGVVGQIGGIVNQVGETLSMIPGMEVKSERRGVMNGVCDK